MRHLSSRIWGSAKETIGGQWVLGLRPCGTGTGKQSLRAQGHSFNEGDGTQPVGPLLKRETSDPSVEQTG